MRMDALVQAVLPALGLLVRCLAASASESPWPARGVLDGGERVPPATYGAARPELWSQVLYLVRMRNSPGGSTRHGSIRYGQHRKGGSVARGSRLAKARQGKAGQGMAWHGKV